MKKFISNFCVQHNERISDKAFLYNITARILGIVACILALILTTYIWFRAGIPDPIPEILNRECLITVSASDQSGTVIDPLETNDSGTVPVLSCGSYTVVISLPAESASGYCSVSTGFGVIYTRAITSAEAPASFSFTLNVEQGACAVFSPYAGVPSTFRIKDLIGNGDVLTFKADGTYILTDN